MAESKEKILRERLSDRSKNLGTQLKFKGRDSLEAQTAQEALDSVYDEVYLHTQAELSQQEVKDILDPDSPARYATALAGLQRMAMKGAKPAAAAVKAAPKLKQGTTADNIVELLSNPEKYGLSASDVENIKTGAFYISGTEDALSPEVRTTIEEIQKEISFGRDPFEEKEVSVFETAWRGNPWDGGNKVISNRYKPTDEELEKANSAMDRLAAQNPDLTREKVKKDLEEKFNKELEDYVGGKVSEMDPDAPVIEYGQKLRQSNALDLKKKGVSEYDIYRERARRSNEYLAGLSKETTFEKIDTQQDRIVAHFEQVKANKARATLNSNSLGILYALEADYNTLRVLGDSERLSQMSDVARAKMLASLQERFPDIKNLGQAKEQLLLSISERVPAVGKMLAAGEHAQLFTDPSGYLASKAAAKITAAVGARIATNTAVNAALTAALAASGPIGWAARGAAFLAQQLLGKALNKYIGGAFGKVWGTGKKLIIATGTALVLSFASGLAVFAAAGGLSIIIIAPLVAIFLLIINNSGYMVPPGPNLTWTTGVSDIANGGSRDNPYIKVVKSPNPTGPFQNSQLPNAIEYTIEIQARQQPLTDIKISYDCDVVKENSSIACPTPSISLAQIQTAPETIVPGTPHVIKYTVQYSPAFRDSLVSDSITVRAKVATVSGEQTTSGFAYVIFGKPPTRCFTFDGSLAANEVALTISAIGEMSARQPRFMDKLCAATPQIKLIKGSGVAGGRTQYPNIYLYDLAFSNGFNGIFYTLTHESGHIFANASSYPTIFNSFSATVPIPTTNDGYVCTYPTEARGSGDDNKKSENFAESVAHYFISTTRYYDCFSAVQGVPNGATFSTAYPAMYNFMRTRVFN